MRRMVRSPGYARARLASGALFAVLGAVVAYRTVRSVGFSTSAIPAFALGGAMFALGALRFRDFVRARNLS